MLEWKPRLITLILIIVLVGLVAGYMDTDSFGGPMNWEW
jgi:hypothetical protein